MTAEELLQRLLEIPDENRRFIEVRVVFHGWERPSFNLPAISTSGPTLSGGLNIICEEAR